MNTGNHKRDLTGLLIFLVLFGVFLIASLISYFNGSALLDFRGLPAKITDLLIAVLSLIGLIRTLWHLLHY